MYSVYYRRESCTNIYDYYGTDNAFVVAASAAPQNHLLPGYPFNLWCFLPNKLLILMFRSLRLSVLLCFCHFKKSLKHIICLF